MWECKLHQPWFCHCADDILNRFVDRDMMMRFRGGGVGHKSTREATNHFLSDRDHVEKHQVDDSDTIVVDQLGEQDFDREDGHGGMAVGGGEDIHETQLNQEEEFDYGYGGLMGDNDGDDSGWVDDDSYDSEDIGFDYDDDMLGAEDGEGAYGDTLAGDLGFGDL
jgi:hypothetical protein